MVKNPKVAIDLTPEENTIIETLKNQTGLSKKTLVTLVFRAHFPRFVEGLNLALSSNFPSRHIVPSSPVLEMVRPLLGEVQKNTDNLQIEALSTLLESPEEDWSGDIPDDLFGET